MQITVRLDTERKSVQTARMTSPIERMIDQACGYKPEPKNFRPRNHKDLNAFIFRIHENVFHVEIYDKFNLMNTEELLTFMEKASQIDSPDSKILVQVIKEVIEKPMPTKKEIDREIEEYEKEMRREAAQEKLKSFAELPTNVLAAKSLNFKK